MWAGVTRKASMGRSELQKGLRMNLSLRSSLWIVCLLIFPCPTSIQPFSHNRIDLEKATTQWETNMYVGGYNTVGTMDVKAFGSTVEKHLTLSDGGDGGCGTSASVGDDGNGGDGSSSDGSNNDDVGQVGNALFIKVVVMMVLMMVTV